MAIERDEELMAQVAMGRREPLGILLRRYGSPLLSFIQRMIGDRHRSEELFQEAFLAVWNQRRDYQFPWPFRRWLFGIALNKCRREFRRPGGVSLPPDFGVLAALPAAEPGPTEAAISAETATIVQKAILDLPEQQRTVVVLRIWNGLSYSEIADVTARTESTVRSHMFHGLAAMRKYLEPRLR